MSSPENRDPLLVNSLVHLYRGELGRMVDYRIRLDTTTNWAIVTTAGVVTLALGDPRIPHVTFLFAMFLNVFFLLLESRRFRVFELSHHRVRELERFFYGELLGHGVEGEWRRRLGAELTRPRLPLGLLEAVGWRLRRNYLWIYSATLLAWLIKLDFVQGRAAPLDDLVRAAAIGWLPGELVLALVLGFYLLLVAAAFSASLRYRPEPD